MAADLKELQTLLVEISEFGAIVEDHEIFNISHLEPLLAKARSLGIDIHAPATVDDLRTAVEDACTQAHGEAADKAPVTTRDILGNEAGIPGDGP